MPTSSKDRPHYNVAVFVLLKNKKGEYLLQQRQNTSYMNGYWDFSGSGHLEHGETIRESVVREAEEECGMRVNPSSLKLVQILQHDVGDWPYIDFLFIGDEFTGDATINEAEKVADLRWFKPEDFPEKLTLALRTFQEADFPTELTYAYANEADHRRITGQEYENDTA